MSTESVEETPKQASEKPKAKERKRRNIKGLVILFLIVAAVIGLVITAICLFINNASNQEIAIYDTDAFFVSNGSGSKARYALYKKNGDKVTDFEFVSASDFVNGYSAVKNKDEKYAIIDHNGKYSVEFGAYDYIYPHIGIYEAKKGDKSSLILGNGTVLAEDYENYEYSSSAPYVAVKFKDEGYKLFNAFGDELASYDSENTPKITDDAYDTASVVSFGENIVILSNKNYKVAQTVITELKDGYSIDKATKNGKNILLRGNNKEKHNYAIYTNEKLFEYGDQCESVSLQSFSDDERFYFTCSKDNEQKLIRNGEITDIKVASYGDGYTVIDENHYASYDEKEKKIHFFVNGEDKKSIEANNRMYLSTNGYAVRDYKKGSVALYDVEGEVVYELKDSTSGDLQGVDKNDNIIVRNPNNESDKKYYLIKGNGDKISGEYSSIVAHKNYYSAYNYKKDTGALLDKDGNEIISGDYKSFDYYGDEEVIVGRKKEGGYDLFNIKDKTVAAKIKGYISYYRAGYIKATEGKKVSYYNTDGKLIYEYEEK